MEENSEILEYYCTNCNTRVNREDTKCPNCGAELEALVDENDEISEVTNENDVKFSELDIPEYYCSKCGARINREDTKCPGCGAEIGEFENDDNDSTIVLKKYTNDVDAELAKSLLEAEGIECFLKGGNSLGTIFTPFSIKLVVLKRDMKRALELLEN